MKEWAQFISRVPEDKQDPCLSSPPMLQKRDLVKGKGVAPPVAPTKMPLDSYEDPDIALAQQLQRKELMVEVVRRGKDPESLHATQAWATAKEEHMGVDVTILVILEAEFLTAE